MFNILKLVGLDRTQFSAKGGHVNNYTNSDFKSLHRSRCAISITRDQGFLKLTANDNHLYSEETRC